MADSDEEMKHEELQKFKKESSYTYWVKDQKKLPELISEPKPLQGDIQIKFPTINLEQMIKVHLHGTLLELGLIF